MTRHRVRVAVERAVRVWRPRLGLDRWQLRVEWRVPPRVHAVAQCSSRYIYGEVTLRFDLNRLAGNREYVTARHLEFLVLHEMSHCLTVGMSAGGAVVPEHLNEIVTHVVARALWVTRYGVQPPD